MAWNQSQFSQKQNDLFKSAGIPGGVEVQFFIIHHAGRKEGRKALKICHQFFYFFLTYGLLLQNYLSRNEKKNVFRNFSCLIIVVHGLKIQGEGNGCSFPKKKILIGGPRRLKTC